MQLVLAWQHAQFFFLVSGYLLWPVAFLAVQIAPFGLLESILVVCYTIIILLVRLGMMAFHPDKDKSLSHHWHVSRRARFYVTERSTFLYVLSAVMILLGLGCFFMDGNSTTPTVMASISHILWHMFSGIAMYGIIVATSDIVTAKLRRTRRGGYYNNNIVVESKN
jgi:hypothetical protein